MSDDSIKRIILESIKDEKNWEIKKIIAYIEGYGDKKNLYKNLLKFLERELKE